jgi:hypothetical protein
MDALGQAMAKAQVAGRRRFTLRRLFFYVTILGGILGLIAFIYPAVQAARTAARRMQEANNLKQVALGLHNYH